MITALMIGGPKDGERLVLPSDRTYVDFPGLSWDPSRNVGIDVSPPRRNIEIHRYTRVSLHGKNGFIVGVYQYDGDDACPIERLIEGYREAKT